jgi:hypothetical protein
MQRASMTSGISAAKKGLNIGKGGPFKSKKELVAKMRRVDYANYTRTSSATLRTK